MSDLPRPFGRYTLRAPLGQGGMGRVYLATLDGPAGFSKQLAIKMIRPDAVLGADALRTALFREARLGALLEHPNIVGTWELGEHDGAPFIAMDYVDGPPLDRALRGAGSPDPAVVVELGAQIAAGLAAAHALEVDGAPAGLVHRDLKPGNVFVGRNGIARIADFGLARLTSTPSTTEPGMAKGTPAYMAPEQIQAHAVDGRADIFALGAVLYELATGYTLFRRDSIVETFLSVAEVEATLAEDPTMDSLEIRVPGLKDIIRQCLRRHPEDRYQTADAVHDALRALGTTAGPRDVRAWLETAGPSAEVGETGEAESIVDPAQTPTRWVYDLDIAASADITRAQPVESELELDLDDLAGFSGPIARLDPLAPKPQPSRWPTDLAAVTMLLAGIGLFVAALAWLIVPGAGRTEAPPAAVQAPVEVPDLPAASALEVVSPAPAVAPGPVAVAPPETPKVAPHPAPSPSPAPRPVATEPTPEPAASVGPTPRDRIELLTPWPSAEPGQPLRFVARIAADAEVTLFLRPAGGAWEAHALRSQGDGQHVAVVSLPRDAQGRWGYRLEAQIDGRTVRLGSHTHHYPLRIQ
mgnify:CR=1 FL=1